ncbi:aminotransferase class V-fold PLP-dependent enzyme [Ferruginibacter sp. HRS2-29]|uniref:aminotransferase class V-fold PLP-dependent enzyme n=1 Tax=Ferruginibacter sp. HRS2-29 TaxID=2487334 RepID=UPI0020CC0832|nr:aminotransferase class V-fold PLP-dependent enzyme [Ferruginibacter sp. HRS2-29]MCP9752611.1 aminotransferase class V-fold PLP-dependent enzyme [Ferruginibacter sp. HRS2-29]
MSNRRSFINKLGVLSAAAITSNIFQPAWSADILRALDKADGKIAFELAGDEAFWQTVQQAYNTPSSFINFNNGGVSPAPRTVAEAMKLNYDQSNQAPSYFMWRILDAGREPLRRRLAGLAGCDREELALQRNASEALETVIFGLDLKAGDEVVLCKKDYPHMMNSWKQREKREGIKLVWVDIAFPVEDEAAIVKKYTDAFTARTKVVHITHLINWIGQKMPVRKIADEAKKRHLEVIVDGAHSFAHFDFKIADLNCDYFGTSLHKWLGAPIGTGFLYVKKEKIQKLWPLFGSPDTQENDIRKFENLGTRPFYIEQAIDDAIDFHEMIGISRKEERLLYLKNYWMEKVKDIPKVKLHTSFKKEFGGAIGLVSVEGKKPGELESYLIQNYRIHCVSVVYEDISGVRITPNVYISLPQLDMLVEGITSFASK